MARASAALQLSPSSTLLLCGGGTGGHVYPALAVADAIAGADAAIVYIGSIGGMEEGIVAAESSLPFRSIPAAALRGRGPLDLLRAGATLAQGTLAAQRLIAELRPAAILGTGGYVCVPLFLAARLARVPTIIYLPDVVPGLAVRLLSRIATLTAVNVEDALPRLGFQQVAGSMATAGWRKAIITGYPVRAELFGQEKAACRRAFGLGDNLPVALVMGGSRGARSVNQAIKALLPSLLAECQLIHVCGREGDAVWLREAAARLPDELQGRYKLFEYLASPDKGTHTGGSRSAPTSEFLPPDMIRAFGAADLAICRSGASTLAELPAAALPAVLVPYPYVHQDENADYLVHRGAAVKVADATMLGAGRPEEGPLFQAVIQLIRDRHERQCMAERSGALARPDAARRLAEALLNLAARSSG